MQYKIFNQIGDDKNRYILEKNGKNQLFIIGLNPSTADEKTPDSTMKKIVKFCKFNGFDGFVMANLYAQRTPKPHQLDEVLNIKISQKNINYIESTLQKLTNPTILCCWGNGIDTRAYLRDCFVSILAVCEKNNPNYKAVALNQTSHPKHPLYQKIGKFIDFDMKSYL